MFRIGFDIGGTNIACGLINEEFEIVEKLNIPFKKDAPDAIARRLYELSKDLCNKHSTPFSNVEVIGVCIPGSIDKQRNTVLNAYNLGFHNVPFRSMIESIMGKPAMLLNDADAATLAEHRIGSLRNAKNAVLITIGTGIGGGIILNNCLFHGGRGNGIELGHIQMDVHGERCTCGRIGCIETLCSAGYLNRQAERLYFQGNAALHRYACSNNESYSAKALIDCAKEGDEACFSVWNEYLGYLSDAMASIINILDPEIIAIGGGVGNAGEFLIKGLNELIAEKCFFDDLPEIVCASLGNDAGMIGAIM